MITEKEFRSAVERKTGSVVTDLRWLDGVDAFRICLSDGRYATVTALGRTGRDIHDIVREAFPS